MTEVDNNQLVAFKRAALEDLGDIASGVLLDLDYGLPALTAVGRSTVGGGLIVAVDRLVQQPGGPVTDVMPDERFRAEYLARTSCVALKLLVLWEPERPGRAARGRLVEWFLRRCRELNVLALLEGVLDEHNRQRARQGDDFLWLDMSRELLGFSPDVYKTELPAAPDTDEGMVIERCRRVSAVAECPWVLLSSGIPVDRFAGVVANACQGGASGFLAGRAIWRAAISSTGYTPVPVNGARQRLEQLVQIVDAYARPWPEAVRNGLKGLDMRRSRRTL